MPLPQHHQMTMALYPSILTQTNLFSPAKPKPLSSTSKPLFLRTPCLILRLHSPTPSSSTFSAKPISQISLTTSLRASSPQKYVYPDPIPEFAEAVSTYISLRVCVNVSDSEFIYMHVSFLGLPISQLAYLCDCHCGHFLSITSYIDLPLFGGHKQVMK